MPGKPLGGLYSTPGKANTKVMMSLTDINDRVQSKEAFCSRSVLLGPTHPAVFIYLFIFSQQSLLYYRCEWWEMVLYVTYGKLDGIKMQAF